MDPVRIATNGAFNATPPSLTVALALDGSALTGDLLLCAVGINTVSGGHATGSFSGTGWTQLASLAPGANSNMIVFAKVIDTVADAGGWTFTSSVSATLEIAYVVYRYAQVGVGVSSANNASSQSMPAGAGFNTVMNSELVAYFAMCLANNSAWTGPAGAEYLWFENQLNCTTFFAHVPIAVAGATGILSGNIAPTGATVNSAIIIEVRGRNVGTPNMIGL